MVLMELTPYEDVLNGVKSDLLSVSMGIPQGSVLGPTLFTLFTNDLPLSVRSGSLYIFADNTTVFCIRDTAEFTPHQGKSEALNAAL